MVRLINMTLSLKSFHVTFHHGVHIIIIEALKYHLHSIGGVLAVIYHLLYAFFTFTVRHFH